MDEQPDPLPPAVETSITVASIVTGCVAIFVLLMGAWGIW